MAVKPYSPIEQLWDEIQAKTGQRFAVHAALCQWRKLSIAADEILNGDQRPILSDETIEHLRNVRYEGNHKAAMFVRRIADIDGEIADLQRQLEEMEKILK